MSDLICPNCNSKTTSLMPFKGLNFPEDYACVDCINAPEPVEPFVIEVKFRQGIYDFSKVDTSNWTEEDMLYYIY